MARTYRNTANTSRKSGGNGTTSERRSQISRALSKLLRHQAESEKVPITPAGWVNVQDLLAWRGLSRIGQGIAVSEIFEVVEEDGRTGKGRFGLRVVEIDGVGEEDNPSVPESENESGSIATDGAATGDLIEAASSLSFDDAEPGPSSPQSATTSTDPTSKNSPETQLTIQHHLDNPSTPASHYVIRATQGHTIRSVGSADLLTPITLAEPSKIPTTVVHGTFYGAWPLILSSGGLKAMGRNNVHFATGPSLEEVLSTVPADTNTIPSEGLKTKPQVDSLLSRNKVISGMRWDAQILIYIDLKRCLEDIAATKSDMTWWRSENGVILTAGVADTADSSKQTAPEPTPQNLPSPKVPEEDVDKGEGEVLIASKHAKAQKHRENIEQEQSTSSAADKSQAQLSQQGEPQPIIASKHAKMQKHLENIEVQSTPPTSTSPPTSQPQAPQQEPEGEVLIASKHAKMQKHLENIGQQHQSQPQLQPPQQPQPEEDNEVLIASKHAKLQKQRENTTRKTHQISKIVPMKYVSHVVEIKAGLGVIWQHDLGGVVQDLPDKLKNTPLPRGKGKGLGGARGGRGKG